MALINGTSAAETLAGSSADDTLLGLGGDDTLLGGGGRDSLDGGAGFDTADFAGVAGDLDVDLAAGVERGVTNAILTSVEAVRGAADDDAIAGDAGANLLDGRGGDDSLAGRDGSDTLAGGEGNNILDGGAGRDTADYSWATGGVLVNLADGFAEVEDPAGVMPAAVDALLGIENAIGGSGNDTIIGDAGPNFLFGGEGYDDLSGGAGDDTLAAGQGEDELFGGGGYDTADFSSATADLVIDLAAGTESATGSTLSSIEAALGGPGDDAMVGDAGANALSGAGGGDSVSGGAGDDTLAGGAGDDSLTGGAGTDTAVFAGRRADFAVAYVTEGLPEAGFVVSDTRAAGGRGSDTVAGVEFFAFDDGTVTATGLLGGPPPDPEPTPVPTFFGTDGDDRLLFRPGNEIIDGLGGRDWIDMLAEGRRGSVVSAQSDGKVAVVHAGETDAIVRVEEIRFADGRLAFDPADPAARVARLYEAALDRLPDQGGLNFWIGSLQTGEPLSSLASGFLSSPEFQSRLGGAATSNDAFVDRLYLNVLGRAGEAEGRAFWTSGLDSGAATRAEVLAAFSESPENQAGTADLVQGGIWDRSEPAMEVARLYDTVFGRRPDVEGLTFWKDGLEDGAVSLPDMADAFTGSAEFRAQYGSLGNTDFANALYVNSLERPAEQSGLDFWLGQLDAGVARSAVVLAFSESAEHVNLTAPAIGGENPAEFGILFA